MGLLTSEILLLSEIACTIGNKNFRLLKNKINRYHSLNYDAAKLYECILQSYLFCGFPAAIESFRIFKKYFDNFHSGKAVYNVSEFERDGKVNCKLIYKKNYKKLIDNMEGFSPDLKEWMIIEGYGKVLNRKGLSLLEREFVNVSILVAGYYETQLHSHLRGCLNLGATSEDLIRLLRVLKPIIIESSYVKSKSLIRRITK